MNLKSKIGIGTAQFGMSYGVSNTNGQTTTKEVQKILNFSTDNHISYLDTAPAYGNAEIVLGNVGIDRFKIISKFMPYDEEKDLNIQLNKSLFDLRVDSIYGYLAHRPAGIIENPKQWDHLLKLKEDKKVKKIGFSLNQPQELEKLMEKGMIPDLVQIPYNYFDNRFRELLIELKYKGCEIHARSPFLQGLFFKNTNELTSYFDDLKSDIEKIRTKFGENLSSVLLKYVLSLDFIDIVIMGVENVDQLIKNLIDINVIETLEQKKFDFKESLLMPSNWPQIREND